MFDLNFQETMKSLLNLDKFAETEFLKFLKYCFLFIKFFVFFVQKKNYF